MTESRTELRPSGTKPYFVGISGAHGTGKTRIINEVELALVDRGYRVKVVSGTTREVLRLTDSHGYVHGFEVEVLSSTFRTLQLLELQSSSCDVVLSERTGLDEVTYSSLYKRPKHLTRTLRDMAHWEFQNIWDSVYYKPIHPDYEIEDDGVRPVEAKTQKGIDLLIRSELDDPNITYRVLNRDIHEAASRMIDSIVGVLKSREGNE